MNAAHAVALDDDHALFAEVVGAVAERAVAPAAAALDALGHGWYGVHPRLSRNRRAEFATKWRFNRAVRSLVASRSAVAMAAAGARFMPSVLRRAMVYAGDCAQR